MKDFFLTWREGKMKDFSLTWREGKMKDFFLTWREGKMKDFSLAPLGDEPLALRDEVSDGVTSVFT